MSHIVVHEASIEDAGWDFRTSAATFRPTVDGRTLWTGTATLDPFPSYAHDVDVVKATALWAESACPPAWDVHLFVADREDVSRTNAFSTLHIDHYADDEVKPKTGIIFLGGKRIPPHPAMTRYLVGHEYGHNVEWMIEAAIDPTRVERGDVIADYARMRGVDDHHGSGGRWHNSSTEIFACDFRILVCEVEPDFWPHPGIPRPETNPSVQRWWEATVPLTDVGQRNAA